MFAIIEVAGQQFKVEKDQNIFVHRLQKKEGEQITLNKILLLEQEGNTSVGMPIVEGYHVKATVLTHLKGDKVKVFKKKRRKGYQVLNGHRQYLTEIRIDAIEKEKAATQKTTTKQHVAEDKEVVANNPNVIPAKKTAIKTKTTKKTTPKATVTAKPKKSAETKTSPKGTVPKTAKGSTAKKKTTTTTAKAKTTSKKVEAKKSTDTKNKDHKKENK